jgi:hypothetical protein
MLSIPNEAIISGKIELSPKVNRDPAYIKPT